MLCVRPQVCSQCYQAVVTSKAGLPSCSVLIMRSSGLGGVADARGAFPGTVATASQRGFKASLIWQTGCTERALMNFQRKHDPRMDCTQEKQRQTCCSRLQGTLIVARTLQSVTQAPETAACSSAVHERPCAAPHADTARKPAHWTAQDNRFVFQSTSRGFPDRVSSAAAAHPWQKRS